MSLYGRPVRKHTNRRKIKKRESVREKPGVEGRLVGKLKGGREEKRCEQSEKGERGGEEEWI